MSLETPLGVNRTGQRGSLRLVFEPRGAKTALAERHASTPFGAVRAGYTDESGAAEVQITNPSGGVLGGDRLEMEVSLAPGASATILTQGATKAYRGPVAEQNAVFGLGSGAFLEYLPHHIIPYGGSNFRQTSDFRLAADATLIYWEAFSAGRVAREERFGYESLSSRTRIFREGLPQVVDGFELSNEGEPFGGYSYVGSLYILGPLDLSSLAEGLHEVAAGGGALASASVPADGLCVVRVLSGNTRELYRTLNACRMACRAYLDLAPPSREVW